MQKCTLIILFCLLHGRSFTQSLAGLTGKRDTSYNTNSAYRSTVKSHPDIKIVQEFQFASVKEKRGVVYCTVGNKDLLLDAFCPKEKTKNGRTAILIMHGGGWRSGNRTQHYPLAQKLASLGYVCFTPEYRLSTDALFPAAVNDIKSAVKWIKKNARKYNVDTTRVTVLGFSAGGELAAFTGVTNGKMEFDGQGCHERYASTVQAIVNIDGTLSFVHAESGEGDDSKKTSAATYWLGFSRKENPALWEQASPLTHAGQQTPPTLFINSSVARMHAGRNDYIKILNGLHIYTEVKEFENSPHGFCLFDPWFEPTVKYIDDFLKKLFKK